MKCFTVAGYDTIRFQWEIHHPLLPNDKILRNSTTSNCKIFHKNLQKAMYFGIVKSEQL